MGHVAIQVACGPHFIILLLVALLQFNQDRVVPEGWYRGIADGCEIIRVGAGVDIISVQKARHVAHGCIALDRPGMFYVIQIGGNRD